MTKRGHIIFLLIAFSVGAVTSSLEAKPSKLARDVAQHAKETYTDDTVSLLAKLVSFPTVHKEGLENRNHVPFRHMTKFLKKKAKDLGLDVADHGAVVVIGLGEGPKRLGVVTHGDVQPADPTKWKKSPFELDAETEPGNLIGRGSEDDKGPIATAMYAMRSLIDTKVPLNRRIELIISYTEESDWKPFQEFLKNVPPPDLNVAIDASYPVVVAEKGWCSIHVRTKNELPEISEGTAYIKEFRGGRFLTQVPDEAYVVIENANLKMIQTLKKATKRYEDISYSFESGEGKSLRITARGVSAHSSTPEDGHNAITHLAAILKEIEWPYTPSAAVVSFSNDLFFTDIYGKNFGSIFYKDKFMGPLTSTLSYVHEKAGDLEIGVNLRRPRGKDGKTFEEEINQAIESWKKQHPETKDAEVKIYVGDPHYVKDAPHVPILLDIFTYFTKTSGVKPISIGGGSHARLVPQGVNFGPSMPGQVYTGHTEHEYIRRTQIEQNLEMYAAMLVELTRE